MFAKHDNFCQLLIGLKHPGPGPLEPCPGRSDLSGLLSICMDWQNTHFTKCTWLDNDGKVCYDLEDKEEKLFSTLLLGFVAACQKEQPVAQMPGQARSIPIPLNIMVRLIESWTRAQSLLLVTVSRGDTIKQSKVGMMGGFAHKRLQLILGDLSATSGRWLCTTLMSCAIVGFLIRGVCLLVSLFLWGDVNPEHTLVEGGGSVIFWSIVLDDLWSKKICKPKMIVWSPVLYSSEMILFLWLYCLIKGRIPLPIQMNFWKNSKRPLTIPPHFWKIILQIFKMDMVAFMQGGIGQIVPW